MKTFFLSVLLLAVVIAAIILAVRIAKREKFNRLISQANGLIDQLAELLSHLEPLVDSGDSFKAIVEFYNLSSLWYDRTPEIQLLADGFYKVELIYAPDRVVREISVSETRLREIAGHLRSIISNCLKFERSRHGYNQTLPGEQVTSSNLFLAYSPSLRRYEIKSVAEWQQEFPGGANEEKRKFLCGHAEALMRYTYNELRFAHYYLRNDSLLQR
jgi:hypothetical protein